MNHDLEGRLLGRNAPEIEAITAILRVLKTLQQDTGNYEAGLALSVIGNVVGQLLAISDMSEAEIVRLQRRMNAVVIEMVADVRRKGGSSLIKRAPLPTVGRG